MADRRDPRTGDFTYIGAYVFGDEAGRILREADEVWSACAEVLVAVREHIRCNEEIIAQCKSTIERVERLLAERHQRT